MKDIGTVATILFLLCLATGVSAQPLEVTSQALLVPKHEATLSSEFSSKVAAIPVKNGDAFQKNDILVEFNCDLREVELAKAQAELTGKKAVWESTNKLSQLNSVSKVKLTEAKVAYEQAQIEVKRLQTEIEKCIIRAPYNGRVVQLYVNPYEIVKTGEPLIDIVDNQQLEVKLYVPSIWLTWLQPEQTFTVSFQESPEHYQAHIVKIGARIDPASQTIEVVGMLDEPHQRLISGMSGEAVFQQ